MRATHISILHAPCDTRIFEKQCRALAAAGYEVHLVVGGASAAEIGGVRLHAIAADPGRPPARRQWTRMARATRRALALRPSTYHLHDPHLIPLGLLLKLLGAPVIYDVHEDYPAHARTKLAGHPLRGRLKAALWRALEALAKAAFGGFVCTSPALARAFPPARTVVVGNFPLHRQYDPQALNGGVAPYRERPNRLAYIGRISEIRGLAEMLRALDLVPDALDCRLRMIGAFQSPELERSAAEHRAWERVDFLGWRRLPEVIRELHGARAGLILLHPLPNHQDAIRSNKLFEYMAAGIPVIASDLPEWRRIVSGNRCGLLVDPLDPAAVARAVEHLLTHPEEADAMGRRGRAAVLERFNWDAEGDRLLALYRTLVGAPGPEERATPATAPALEPVAR
jgi:glycosyltransferase involved in cell wall biosynthesis